MAYFSVSLPPFPPLNIADIKESNIYVRQDYVLSPDAVAQHFKSVYVNKKKVPELVIIVGQVLHQLNELSRGQDGLDKFKKGTIALKKDLYPKFQEMLEEANFTTKVIFLHVEPLDAENAMMDRKEKRLEYPIKNSYIEIFNKFLEETVPITGYNKKIFRMAANLDTVKSPFLDRSLLVEGIHLSWKRIGPVITAPSILANLNILLNLLCNHREGEEYCCYDEVA